MERDHRTINAQKPLPFSEIERIMNAVACALRE